MKTSYFAVPVSEGLVQALSSFAQLNIAMSPIHNCNDSPPALAAALHLAAAAALIAEQYTENPSEAWAEIARNALHAGEQFHKHELLKESEGKVKH